MDKSEIQIKNIVVHILDASLGTAVYSDEEPEYGSDFGDFLREHIYRVYQSDDIKNCRFLEDSTVYTLLQEVMEEKKDFLSMSKELCGMLYNILKENTDIPSADVAVVYFEVNMVPNLAILKMNYKSGYTHATETRENKNVNRIIQYHSILPAGSQKLSEAAVINLSDFQIRLLEKKYEINNVKENYFSKRFLGCSTEISQKARLAAVEKAVQSVQKEFLNESEQFEEHMKAKSIIHNEIEQQGSISIPEVAAKVFERSEERRVGKECT